MVCSHSGSYATIGSMHYGRGNSLKGKSETVLFWHAAPACVNNQRAVTYHFAQYVCAGRGARQTS